MKSNAEATVLATCNRVRQSIRSNRPALQQIPAGAAANLLGLFDSAHQTLPSSESPGANAIKSAIGRLSNYSPDLSFYGLIATGAEFYSCRQP